MQENMNCVKRCSLTQILVNKGVLNCGMLFKVQIYPAGTDASSGGVIWFAQHGHILTGESPEATLIVGRLQPKARVSVATRNLKEAGGKHLV